MDPQARAWLVGCLACMALSLGLFALPAQPWEWRLDLAWTQPWRWWSASWVHFGAAHLAMNLAGCLVVAALGRAAQLGGLWAVAWLLVWPVPPLGMALFDPTLSYRGLSGVLHAGVAVASVALLCRSGRGLRRWGVVLGAGLALKVVVELPWHGQASWGPGGGFVVAAWAHASGCVAGWIAAAVAAGLWRTRARWGGTRPA